MNIILITEKECELGIAKTDARAFHIDNILKKRGNETLLLGIEGNPIIYQANIERNQDFYVFKNLVYCEVCPSPRDITIILGLSRPSTMKKLLKDFTTLGVKKIEVIKTQLSEDGYEQSSLWKNNKYLSYIREGACQTKSTFIPSLTVHKSLKSYLKTLSQKLLSEKRIAFDVGKKSYPHILNYSLTSSKIFLAIGSERGWTSEEIQELKNYNFSFLSLGNRILRTETASLISLYYFSEQIDQLTFQPNFGRD